MILMKQYEKNKKIKKGEKRKEIQEDENN